MKILGNIKRVFRTQEKRGPEKGKGLIILNEVSEAMRAERILNSLGYDVRGVAPPSEIRKGCDLSVEFNLVDQLGVERILKNKGLEPLEIVVLDNLTQKPLEITKEKDFGKYLMVTAANMKITVNKETGIIVNISGGGCPDVPFLTKTMVGKLLGTADNPEEIGYSLCAYMLKKAYEKALTELGVERSN